MRALPCLLSLTLGLLPTLAEDHKAEQPAKASADKHGKEAKVEAAPKSKEEPAPQPAAAKATESPAPAAAKPAAPKPDPELARQARRLRELEARAKRLEAENARLKSELAEKVDSPAHPAAEAGTPEGALAELKAGNARFVAGARIRSVQAGNDPALRQTLAKGQTPFAVIVTCSDSRLTDNFIFDQELGRLFTIREAGNCTDLQGLASIEYAVEHLGSRLVVVLGHGSCGAVKAVMESGQRPLPGNLWSLQAAMAGLLESVRHDPNESPTEHLGHLVEANARRQAQAIVDRSGIVKHLVDGATVKVVPAVYDLTSGKVSFLAAPVAVKAEAHH